MIKKRFQGPGGAPNITGGACRSTALLIQPICLLEGIVRVRRGINIEISNCLENIHGHVEHAGLNVHNISVPFECGKCGADFLDAAARSQLARVR